MSKSYLGKLGEAPVVMLCGPIAYWWDTDTYQHWDLPEHKHYVKWRNRISDALVEAGYLVYRPHEAFKGTWNNRMQNLNNTVLELSDFIINMQPEGTWSDGTDEEMIECARLGKIVIYAPPPRVEDGFNIPLQNLLDELASHLEICYTDSGSDVERQDSPEGVVS